MKKFISVLMVMIMLVSMMPFGAFAEEQAQEPKNDASAAAAAQPAPEAAGDGQQDIAALPGADSGEEDKDPIADGEALETTDGVSEEPEEKQEETDEESGSEADPSEETKDAESEETGSSEDPEDKDSEETEENQDAEKEESKEETKAPVPTWDVDVGYMLNGEWVFWQTVKVPQDTGLIPRPQGNLPLSGYKIIGWYFSDTNVPVVFNDSDGATVITETAYKSIYALLEEDIVTYTVTLSYSKSGLMDEIIYNVPTGYVFVDDERLKTYEDGTIEETAEDGTVTVYKFSGWDYDGAQILSDTTLHAIWEVVETIAPEAETEPEETAEISQETDPAEEPEAAEETELAEEAEFTEGTELTEETENTYSVKEEETDKEWVKGSGKGLSLASEADLDKFVALYIDGQLVSLDSFILTEGSTVATLSEEFLESLADGEHTFEIVSSDGSAVSSFKVMSLGATPAVTVTFNMNGHGTQIDPVEPDEEGKVEKPADPEETGWKFEGWYKDEGLTEAFVFENETVSESIDLYAKWTEITFTVTFDYNDKSGTYKTAQDSGIPYNGTAEDPNHLEDKVTTVDYTDEKGNKITYRFLGWDSSLENITEDKTVKATWGAASPNVIIDYSSLNGKVGGYNNYSYSVDAGGTTDPMPSSPALGEIVSYSTRSSEAITEYIYKFVGWEITKGSGVGTKLVPGGTYGEIWDDTTITAQWVRLRQVKYKVTPTKYASIVKGAIISGIYNENGTPKTGVLENGDVFYVYEDEPFSIYSGVGNGVYVGLYIKSITYGESLGVEMTEYTDTRIGSTSSSYTVNISQTRAAATGDDFDTGLWLTLAFASLAGALMTFKKRTGKRAK